MIKFIEESEYVYDVHDYYERINDVTGEIVEMQCIILFPNKYGASVIKREFSYRGVYEIAVISWDIEDDYGTPEVCWHLCYSTEITDDVLDGLSEAEVLETLEKISCLK